MSDPSNIVDFIAKFRHQWIGVIGDVMLDHYVLGDVHRVSPEAPTPVVDVAEDILLPGGAANVAKNISSLGAKVSLLGIIGDDAAGSELARLLRSEKIDMSGLMSRRGSITTQKIRVVARGQQVVRLDREKKHFLSRAEEAKLLKIIRKNIGTWGGIIVSDYAKGVVTPGFARKVVRLSRAHKKPLFVDPKPADAKYFRGAFLLTPNAKEAEIISGVSDIRRAGDTISKQLDCNVLITRGADGMTLFEKGKTKHFPARAKEVFDVTGAGDTVAATMMLALASGAELEESAYLANCAAGVVVGKQGTATLTIEELKNSLA